MNAAKLALLISKSSPKLAQTLGRKSLVLNKQRPHILFGVGVAGAVTSTVLACRATLKLSDMLDEIQSDVEEVKALKNGHGGTANYPTEEGNRDVAYVYMRSALRLGRLYAPALGVGVVSIGCLSMSHADLTRRNAGLMAAYATLQGAFESYRDRVRVELGADRELDVYRGVLETKIDEDGEIQTLHDPNNLSVYARFFDEYSECWEKSPELNRLFLACQQNYFNDLLRARGHVFLNEVYDRLGLERSQAGQVVGWIVDGAGDGYIDFGMYNRPNSQFINGWERSILLDFNVDGLIYNRI